MEKFGGVVLPTNEGAPFSCEHAGFYGGVLAVPFAGHVAYGGCAELVGHASADGVFIAALRENGWLEQAQAMQKAWDACEE